MDMRAVIDQTVAEIAPTIFYDFNLRYIVLDYWQMPAGPERGQTEHWVTEALGDKSPVYEDGRLKVYQTPSRGQQAPYLSLGNGWSPLSVAQSGRSRSITGQAELFGHHLLQPSHLDIAGKAGDAGRATLVVSNGGGQLAALQFTSEPTSYSVPLPETEGLLKLTLTAERPVSISRIGLKTHPE